jgi:hypothetical protein
MILLAVIIVSAMVAYWGMGVGLYAAFSRYLMAVVAVVAGVGFGGVLRAAIPSASPYLYGPCLFTVAAVVYWIESKLADFCIRESDLSLPVFVDRLGGGFAGFAVGLMALSFLALAIAAVPLPASAQYLGPELRQIARVAVGTTRVVGSFAGTGVPITLETVLPG